MGCRVQAHFHSESRGLGVRGLGVRGSGCAHQDDVVEPLAAFCVGGLGLRV